jgi:uncharacterized membrane-anchored protein YjiN (DUF445 family)
MRDIMNSGDILPPLDPHDFEPLTTPVELSEELIQREHEERVVQETVELAYHDESLQADPAVRNMVQQANLEYVKSLASDSWKFDRRGR